MSEITINPEHRMNKNEAEMHEKAIFDNIEDTGMRLLKLREERGWEALNFKSFYEYAKSLSDKISIGKIWYLVDQAEVNTNLSEATGRPVHLPVKHALALKDLEPLQQVEAFRAVTKGYKKGDPKPTEKVFQKVASKITPPSKSKPPKLALNASDGWSEGDLAKDKQVADAFTVIEAIYGASDTKSIRDGTVPMKRADVLYLARLPKENMVKIQDLIFTTRWTPERCIKFINEEPDEDSKVRELNWLCLTTKGKYWTGDFGNFAHTVKLKTAAKR
jgi:hypothetical protein